MLLKKIGIPSCESLWNLISYCDGACVCNNMIFYSNYGLKWVNGSIANLIWRPKSTSCPRRAIKGPWSTERNVRISRGSCVIRRWKRGWGGGGVGATQGRAPFRRNAVRGWVRGKYQLFTKSRVLLYSCWIFRLAIQLLELHTISHNMKI